MILNRAARPYDNALVGALAGLRGLAAAGDVPWNGSCPDPAKYHVVTHTDDPSVPAGQAVCRPSVAYQDSPQYVSQVNQEIAHEIAVAPTAATAVWETQYGNLPQTAQNALMDCMLERDNNKRLGTPVEARCQQPDAAVVAAATPAVITPSNAPNVIPVATPSGIPQLVAAPVLPPQGVPSGELTRDLQQSTSQPGTVTLPPVTTSGGDNQGLVNNPYVPGTPAWLAWLSAHLYQQPSQPVAQSASQPVNVPSYPLTAHIENLTRGTSTQFRVGDAYRITITGQPNQPVSVTGTQNGITSTSSYGSTDASGQLVVTGQIDNASIGNWVEQWFVGGQIAGSFAFTVSPVPSSQPQSYGDGGSGSGGTTNPLTTAAADSCLELFGDTNCWGPIGDRTALVGLLAVGVLMYAMGSRKGR